MGGNLVHTAVVRAKKRNAAGTEAPSAIKKSSAMEGITSKEIKQAGVGRCLLISPTWR